MFRAKREIYPLIALRDTVVFPYQILPLTVARPKSVKALEEAMAKDRTLVFVAQKEKENENPSPSDLYSLGCLASIQQMSKRADGIIQVLVEGLSRVKILDYLQKEPFFKVEIQEIIERSASSVEIEGLTRTVLSQFRQCIELSKIIPPFETLIFSIKDPNRVSDFCIFNLDLPTKDRQAVLETIDTRERLIKVNAILAREIKILQVGKKIQTETEKELGKMQKEVILREQLKAIQKELGTGEEEEFTEIAKKIKAAGMSEEVKAKAEKELDRLKKMPPYSPEIPYIRTYLDWLVDLPWSKKSDGEMDVKKAEKILEEDHYGLNKVKERIVEYLAVNKLVGKIKGPIICFVGPPGTGKTSIGRSIARAMDRKFIRISLGGIRDEAEIRGHRRTYVGALPGRIIQGVKNAGTKNPVFMLDEIDKVGADFRGDPSAALLEALDPEQNFAFSDHYLEVPFDLSEVMFITTANITDTIPPALLDRMEIIPFPGYTEEEKFHIGEKYLIPKQLEAHGLKDKKITFTDSAIRKIIREYTKEAGVRELERQVASVCRKIAKQIAEIRKGKGQKYLISPDNIHKYLGPPKYRLTVAEEEDEIGVATGLAVTEAGGEVLFVESTLMPGKGNLTLTGHLGDVMKESAQAAVSYARSIAQDLGVKNNFYEKTDAHIHVPAGAIPKDGPSAGIAVATSVVSALSKIPVKREVGMTGEITLRGRVLEIGGVKEKVLAAHRAGVKEVILPAENKKDLEDVPKNVKNQLKFHFVEHMDEVLALALKFPGKKLKIDTYKKYLTKQLLLTQQIPTS